jgi:ABC-type Fe3+/spermidine/putrescine transport system ATPase subunit
MIRVHLDGLVKRFDRVPVVDGASLELASGELTVVLGPSGAGKSTLARLLAGLDTLDAGEIFFDSRIVHTLPAHERRVGMVFQDDALWPRLTVAENVSYALKFQGVPRPERKERVAEALNSLRIDSLATTRPGALSGPQRQRVALARALAGRPELLILDEPLDSLDLPNQIAVAALIRRIATEQGIAVLLVAHDVNPLLGYLDRVVYLGGGRALAGTVEEVITAEKLTSLYGAPVEVLLARDGRMVVVGLPEAPHHHGHRHGDDE